MRGALLQTDAFLRGGGLFAPARATERPWWWLPVMIIVFSSLYGAVMGTYNVGSAERLLQVAYSALKVPLLLLVTSLLCLPAFFVLNTVLGLRDDFREALQAILAGQAGLSVALASLSPVVRFWYFSNTGYAAAQLFNAFLFAIATIAGHLVMRRYYGALFARRPAHRVSLYGWVILYAFVGIQMGWTLRPFIGIPAKSVTFFRDEPFSNAYVFVAGLVFGQ
jgi:hypothetical protein